MTKDWMVPLKPPVGVIRVSDRDGNWRDVPIKPPPSEPPPDWTVQIHPEIEPLLTWQQILISVAVVAFMGMWLVVLLAGI